MSTGILCQVPGFNLDYQSSHIPGINLSIFSCQPTHLWIYSTLVYQSINLLVCVLSLSFLYSFCWCNHLIFQSTHLIYQWMLSNNLLTITVNLLTVDVLIASTNLPMYQSSNLSYQWTIRNNLLAVPTSLLMILIPPINLLIHLYLWLRRCWAMNFRILLHIIWGMTALCQIHWPCRKRATCWRIDGNWRQNTGWRFLYQERTGAEPEEGSTGVGTSAVQQVEEAFGVPVVSVVGLSHLTEYLAAKGDSAGANAEVWYIQSARNAT